MAITMREIIPYRSPAPDVTMVPAIPDATMLGGAYRQTGKPGGAD